MDKVRQDVPGKGNSMVRRLRGDGASEGSCRERVLIHMADGSLDCLDTTSIKYKSAIIFEILNISFHTEIPLPRIYLADTLPPVQRDVLNNVIQ